MNGWAAAHIFARRHMETGIRGSDMTDGARARVPSNYLDLTMITDYWSEKRLNHHTEATSMLYARFGRHTSASKAMGAGLRAMGLDLFGSDAHRMTNVTGVYIPQGIDGERVRTRMHEDFEIEISSAFGPLQGKIWRIGAMGYNAEKHKVLLTLGALEAVSRAEGHRFAAGAGVDTGLAAYSATTMKMALPA